MYVLNKICKECPFVNTSAPGWLGPHTIGDLKLFIDSEYPFSCHLHRNDETTEKDVIEGKIPVCRGFLASSNKSCKLFINPELKKLQKEVKENTEHILAKWELEKHHTQYKSNK